MTLITPPPDEGSSRSNLIVQSSVILMITTSTNGSHVVASYITTRAHKPTPDELRSANIFGNNPFPHREKLAALKKLLPNIPIRTEDGLRVAFLVKTDFRECRQLPEILHHKAEGPILITSKRFSDVPRWFVYSA